MSIDTDDASKLLAAATQTTNRSMRLIYAAEAKLYIMRERGRLRQQELLLDAIEAELVQTTVPESERTR